LIISHDRYFLDRLIDKVVEVRGHKLEPYVGSYASWWAMRHEEGEQRRSAALSLQSRKQSAEKPKSDNQLQQETLKAQQRDRRRLERQVSQAEERIAALEERRGAVTTELEEAYSTGGAEDRALALAQELKQIQRELPEANARWEELAEQLEDA